MANKIIIIVQNINLKDKMFHEHQHRSLFKSTTWFITAYIATFVILFIINGELKTSLLETTIIQVIKAFIYYLHERLWNRSNYGQRFRKPTIVMK